MGSSAIVTKVNELAAQQGLSIEKIHAESVIEKVPISVVKVDRDYQREPTQRHVDDIANNWDEVSAELLLMSRRHEDGHDAVYVVNGQHRTLGARKAGVEAVWSRVLDLREAHDPGAIEAMFRLRTNKRMGDRPLERFKAQRRAGDEESIAIVELLSKFDAEVNEIPVSDTGINAISTVERIYRIDDGHLLAEVLQMIKDAYGYVGSKYASASVMAGLGWVIIKHGDEAERDRLVSQLHNYGITALNQRMVVTKGTMGGPLWTNLYRAVVEIYNENLSQKNKLEWRLKGSSNYTGAAQGWASSRVNAGLSLQ